MTSADREIQIDLADVPACTRCGGPSLFSARFAHSWTNAGGQEVTGVREVVLCPECDRGEPAADELGAFFAVDDQLGLENMDAFGALVETWLDAVQRKSMDLERLQLEEEQWRAGDL